MSYQNFNMLPYNNESRQSANNTMITQSSNAYNCSFAQNKDLEEIDNNTS
jgi:hypothetical protein